MKKILDMKYPLITMYPQIANLLSILQSQEGTDPWFCNNYIQLLYFLKADGTGVEYDMTANFMDSYYESNAVHTAAYCPYIEYYKLSREIIRQEVEPLMKHIRLYIENNFYIYTNLNIDYLKCSAGYGKGFVLHPSMIYGYDEKHHVVYAADFYRNGKYSYELIPYDDFEKAFYFEYNGVYSYEDAVGLLRFVPSNYCIDIPSIKRSLQDYINGVDSTRKFLNSKDYLYYYGVSCYDKTMEAFAQKKFDIRNLHLFYEHKVIMKKRVEILAEHKYINLSSANILLERIQSIADKTKILRNMLVKEYLVKYNRDPMRVDERLFLKGLEALKIQDVELHCDLEKAL